VEFGRKKLPRLQHDAVWFRKGVEGHLLSRRAASRKANALIDRRSNEDIIWKLP
jgi:hypothetical protein